MARLSLKFEDRVLQEVTLTRGVVTIGRQPDNLVCIDNPIVSGYHARIFWENDRYFLEDIESFNGTYLNNRRIRKEALNDGDVVLIGKHVLQFHGTVSAHAAAASATLDRSPGWQAQMEKARPPQLQRTMIGDVKKAREKLAQMGGPAPAMTSIGVMPASGVALEAPLRRREIGTVTILSGRTDQQHYVLSSKLSVIGKSPMASIRLKRWFAPRVAASIHQREDGYFLVAAGENIKIRVNHAKLANGQQELKSGDQFEVAGITAMFGYEKG
jgi:predicted component of type VI protein secretion system